MKKAILPILTVCVLAVFAASCELTQLNENTKEPSEVPAKNLVTNAQVQLGTLLHNVYDDDAPYMYLAQHWSATLYNGVPRYSLGSDQQNIWNTFYSVLKDLKRASKLIANAVGPGVNPAVQKNKQAIIDVVQILAWSKLVNTFGNVPFTEALNAANPLPAYDDAHQIYINIIDSLNTAIKNMTVGTPSFGSADVYYGGDIGQWKKFANSLKLRLGMMLADVSKDGTAEKIVESAVSDGVFTSNADNAMVPFESTKPFANPVWENVIASGRHDYLPGESLLSRMNNLDDPRRKLFFTKYQGEYKGGIYGEKNPFGEYSHFSETMLMPGRDALIMGYAEVEFLLAEARARGYNVGGTAEGHYIKAIKADMQFWNVRAAAAGQSERITTAEINDYLSQPEVQWSSSNWRNVLGLQKWIGLYGQWSQAYTSYRRLDAPDLEAPEKANWGLTTVPVRLRYPASETRVNPENYEKASKAIGGDTYTNRLFWDTMDPGGW